MVTWRILHRSHPSPPPRLHCFSLAILFAWSGFFECCFQPCYTDPPPLENFNVYTGFEVGEVEIVPITTFARATIPGQTVNFGIGSVEIPPQVTSFQLEARIKDPSGEVITHPSIQVEWSSGSGVIQVEPGTGNPTVVTLPSFSILQNAFSPLVLDVHRLTFSDVTAKAGTKVSTPAKFIVSDGGDSAPGDRIEVAHPEGAPPSVVLLTGIADGQCKRDRMFSVAGMADLSQTETVTGNCPSGELVAFSPTRAGAYLPGSGTGIWEAGSGQVALVPASRTPIPVTLWKHLERPDENVWGRIYEDYSRAKVIFERSRTGFLLAETGPVDRDLRGTVDFEFTGSGCTDDSELEKIFGSTTWSGLATGVVHVVYVDGIGTESDPVTEEVINPWIKGNICFWTSSREFAVVVVSYADRSISTLAHELGHLFGLNSRTLFGDGHTDVVANIDRSNIMHPTNSFDAPGERERFTIGQVYRMNFDSRSWVRYLQGATALTSFKCQCNPYTDDPCPFLFSDVVDVGPAPLFDPSDLCSDGAFSDPWW
jgi:hypothetical protein